MKRWAALICAGLAGAGATSRPARDLPPTYDCARAAGAIAIDGSPDEPAWASAAWTADFIDVRGTDHRIDPPPLRTRAKLLWDERCLYVAAELAAPRVEASIARRDEQLYREQAFELFLDPGGDGRDYLELQVNPLNTVCDLVMNMPYSQRGKADVAFDLDGLTTAVKVRGTINDDAGGDDEGWTVELAIPWRALRRLSESDVPPRATERWRVNMARMHPGEPRACWVWAAQGAMNLHAPDRWGWVTFANRESK